MLTIDTLTIVMEVIIDVMETRFQHDNPESLSPADDLGMDSLEIVETIMEIDG